MLKLLDIGVDNAIAICISGKITQEEVTQVLNITREKIEHYGDIVIYKELDSFKGVELAAIVEEFKYLFDVGLSNISKAALVTDKRWLKELATIEDKLFKDIEIKCFTLEEKDAAIAFLRQEALN